ncbi:hypothetical protein EIN_409140 [Entamoeba invadens IP1]|uniref:Importin subunit alpha-1 n=1 Tax=Entamoeba invadens IP1 TaxID=370355 RepID=A0A0A1TZL9_ENTIV|nr:hypothetical protein EIN_409140 [Entamoeba invadens IP1]ELP85625.1 hypothetical protein EIN_409140 [Entamoeba invadens IP1]|eukprot:XP_004184971.1 hypothetical protein EIN_409140 [Entamoeba invadens IP1]
MAYRLEGSQESILRSHRISQDESRQSRRERQKEIESEKISKAYEKVEDEVFKYLEKNLSVVPVTEDIVFQSVTAVGQKMIMEPKLYVPFMKRVIPVLFRIASMCYGEPLFQQIRSNGYRVFIMFAQILVICAESPFLQPEEMIKIGFVDMCLKYLTCDNDQVIAVTLDSISTACTHPLLVSRFLNQNLFGKLVTAVASIPEVGAELVYRQISSIIRVICSNYQYAHDFVVSYIIFFSKLININDILIMTNMMHAIHGLYMSGNFVNELRPLRAEERCIKLLELNTDEKLCEACLLCLGAYVFQKDDLPSSGQICGVAVTKITTSPEYIQKICFWILSNISAGSFEGMTENVVSSGGLMLSCKFIVESTNAKIKIECGWVLTNVLYKLTDLSKVRSDLLCEAIVITLLTPDQTMVLSLLAGIIKLISFDNLTMTPTIKDKLNELNIMQNYSKLLQSPNAEIRKRAAKVEELLRDSNSL